MALFRLDYISCLLTILATFLVGRKLWSGLALSILNSLIVCVIAVHTSQYGFIPANVFCIGIYAFSIRSWLTKAQKTAQPATEPVAIQAAEAPALKLCVSSRGFSSAQPRRERAAYRPATARLTLVSNARPRQSAISN